MCVSRFDDYQRNNLSWGMSLLHQHQILSPNCEETRSQVTQDERKMSTDNITCWWPVQCPLCRLTKNFTAIAVLHDLKSQDRSLFDYTKTLKSGQCVPVTKLESTMLIHKNNVRQLCTWGDHYYESRPLSLLITQTSLSLHKLLSSQFINWYTWSPEKTMLTEQSLFRRISPTP